MCEWVDQSENFQVGIRIAFDDWEHNNNSPCDCVDFRGFSQAKEMARYELLSERIRKVVEDFYSSEDMEVIISTKSE